MALIVSAPAISGGGIIYTEPVGITSQGVSGSVYAMYGIGDPSPDPPPGVPVFRSGVESFDWFRIAFLALGIVIGLKVLSK